MNYKIAISVLFISIMFFLEFGSDTNLGKLSNEKELVSEKREFNESDYKKIAQKLYEKINGLSPDKKIDKLSPKNDFLINQYILEAIQESKLSVVPYDKKRHLNPIWHFFSKISHEKSSVPVPSNNSDESVKTLYNSLISSDKSDKKEGNNVEKFSFSTELEMKDDWILVPKKGGMWGEIEKEIKNNEEERTKRRKSEVLFSNFPEKELSYFSRVQNKLLPGIKNGNIFLILGSLFSLRYFYIDALNKKNKIMRNSIGKAAFIFLSMGGGIKGFNYFINNYSTEAESPKSEIQNLEGRIPQKNIAGSRISRDSNQPIIETE